MVSVYVLFGIMIIQAAGHIWIAHIHSKRFKTAIDRQNDTIQRLINREPVTYAEVNSKPQKPQKEIYAAWGAQMVDLDEEESQ